MRCEGSLEEKEAEPRVVCSEASRRAVFPFRITFFAHPHRLTPIESYSCKNRGMVGYLRPLRIPVPSLFFHSRLSAHAEQYPQLRSFHIFTSQFSGYPGWDLPQPNRLNPSPFFRRKPSRLPICEKRVSAHGLCCPVPFNFQLSTVNSSSTIPALHSGAQFTPGPTPPWGIDER
jgi:hypothetical protein